MTPQSNTRTEIALAVAVEDVEAVRSSLLTVPITIPASVSVTHLPRYGAMMSSHTLLMTHCSHRIAKVTVLKKFTV